MSLTRQPHHRPLVRRTRIAHGKVRIERAPFRRDTSGNYGSTLKRSHAKRLDSKKPEPGKYSTLNRRGHNSHSQDWPRVWRTLKRELERDGITRCERCGTDQRLTPAHSLKRRHITNRTHMREVAILCVECHDTLELQGEAKMSKAIRAIIAGRGERRLQAA